MGRVQLSKTRQAQEVLKWSVYVANLRICSKKSIGQTFISCSTWEWLKKKLPERSLLWYLFPGIKFETYADKRHDINHLKDTYADTYAIYLKHISIVTISTEDINHVPHSYEHLIHSVPRSQQLLGDLLSRTGGPEAHWDFSRWRCHDVSMVGAGERTE